MKQNESIKIVGPERPDLKRYIFLQEPSGAVFYQLLEHGLSFAKYAVIVQTTVGQQASLNAFLSQFKRELVKHFVWKELEGYVDTSLAVPPELGIYVFEYKPSFVKMLRTVKNRLYSTPENFGLLRSANINDPWLHSTTHEQAGAMHLTMDEKADFDQALPEVTKIVAVEPNLPSWG